MPSSIGSGHHQRSPQTTEKKEIKQNNNITINLKHTHMRIKSLPAHGKRSRDIYDPVSKYCTRYFFPNENKLS